MQMGRMLMVQPSLVLGACSTVLYIGVGRCSDLGGRHFF